MDDRETLNDLRRLDELSARAGGTALAEPPEATSFEKALGSVPGRFALGVGSPAIAAMQFLGGEKGRQKAQAIEEMKQHGMAANGSEGYDWAGLLGSLLPGAGIAKGVTAALPVAKTLGAKLLQGGATGAATAAAQPVTPSPDFLSDKAKQVGIGAMAGAAIPAVSSALVAARGVPRLNPVQAQTLAEGQQAGYVVPPSAVNPSFLNNRLESLAGKAAVGQEAAKRNQEVTNALAARSIGLPEGTSLTPGTVEKTREMAGTAYTDVTNLDPKAAWALDQLKQARHDATLQFTHYNKSGDPAALTKAKEAKAWAGLMDNEIEDAANNAERPDLVKALTDARVKIAKTYDVDRALNEANADVSAPMLGRMFDKKGSNAMTGDLATAGKMALAFPSAMREGARVPASGVSGTDAAASAILGTMGYGAGGPAGILAAGLPLLRGPARNLVLSPAYQRFATQGLSPQRQAMIAALMQQGAGAAGTTAGRIQP